MDEARAKRLKAALRDNLGRRKAQARERAADPAAPPAVTPKEPVGDDRATEGDPASNERHG